MKVIYNILMIIILPFALLRLLWRSRHNHDYRLRLGERFTLRFCTSRQAIWIHTVSVGEFLAAVPLIDALLEQYDNILVTTTTPTGSAMVCEKIRNQWGERVAHQYLPFDAPLLVSRFLNATQPCIAVFVETEIWANYLAQLNNRNIPSLLINARLSARSFSSYEKLGKFVRDTVGCFSEVACQNRESVQRFEHFGANATLRGNLKFDLRVPNDLSEKQRLLKKLLQSRDFILVASTHKGEDELILSAYQQTAESRLLVIAPRHPERSTEIVAQVKNRDLKVATFTELSQKVATLTTEKSRFNDSIDVLIVDTLGQLLPFYSLADYAIIGGSFVPHGGHNPLESALFATPCVIGEHYFNFEGLINEMRDEKAIAVIAAENLFQYQPSQELGNKAQSFLSKNQGAVENYCALISRSLQ